MKNSILKIAFATLAITLLTSTDADAQLFRNMTRQRNFHSQYRQNGQQNYGTHNRWNHGGAILQDHYSQQPTTRHQIRNNRILRNGATQWVPNVAIPRNGVIPATRYVQPRSKYAAGPTVGGRFKIQDRPRPQARQNSSGWQPWMHVPLDGSQPWNS